MSKEDTALGELRVLDLANEFGVYCGKLLAGMGANVIKVEKLGGDATRGFPPFFEDDPNPEKSLFFAYENTGKKSITLNLETRDGQEIFKKLAMASDVILETFPVGYMARLGIGYPDLKKLNPKLIMISITPFGQTGPHKNWNASSEIVPAAMGGMMFQSGEEDMPPLQMGSFLIGCEAAMYATVGALAALHDRAFTEKGGHVDISMQDCVASGLDAAYGDYQNPPNQITKRIGSQSPPPRVPAKLFPCKDGYFYILGAGRWNLIVAWLINEDIEVGGLVDSKYETMNGGYLLWEVLPEVNRALSELGMKYTGMQLMLEGQKRGIPVTIVSNSKDVYESPQLRERQFFVEVEHPVLGKLKYAGAPYKMEGSPWQIGGPAPLIGQHNVEVYQELGFSKQDLATLKANGVI